VVSGQWSVVSGQWQERPERSSPTAIHELSASRPCGCEGWGTAILETTDH
jgi:hypothetical protein